MSTFPYDHLERRRLEDVRSGKIRIIHSQSARKHRRKGDRVQWCGFLNSYIWFPGEKACKR